jgi:hypothetical protein
MWFIAYKFIVRHMYFLKKETSKRSLYALYITFAFSSIPFFLEPKACYFSIAEALDC